MVCQSSINKVVKKQQQGTLNTPYSTTTQSGMCTPSLFYHVLVKLFVILSLEVLRSLCGPLPSLVESRSYTFLSDHCLKSWDMFILILLETSKFSVYFQNCILGRTKINFLFCFIYIRFSTRWRNEWNLQDWISNAIALGQQRCTSQSDREIWEIQPDFNCPVT